MNDRELKNGQNMKTSVLVCPLLAWRETWKKDRAASMSEAVQTGTD